MSSLERLVYNTFSNVKLTYYEKVNSTYAEALIAGLVIFVYLHYRLKYWAWQGIPNDITSMYSRRRSPYHVADNECYKKYGKIVGIYEGLKPALLVGDLCMIRQLLIKDFYKFPNHRFDVDGNSDDGINFLYILKHNPWKRVRTIINPAFSSVRIKKMQDLVQESLDFLVHNMEVMSINGYSVDMKKNFGSFAMDVISSCAFGTKVNSLQNPDDELVKNAKKLFGQNVSFSFSQAAGSLFPSVSKTLRFKSFDYSALEFIRNTMTTIMKERKDNPQLRGNDFIQLLIDASEEYGGSLSNVEIIDQCILFMITGYETTTAALCSAAYCLAANEESQEKLIEEIDSVNLDGLDYDSLHSLPYLDAYVCEVLRFMPPVPRIERKAAVDCMLGDVFVAKDTLIVIPVYAIHHDPENFSEPEQFSPERFLNGARSANPYSFLPFATGPRNCIGMQFALLEIKLSLIHILQKFKFAPCAETVMPPEFVVGQLVTTPKTLVLSVIKR